MGEIAFLRGPCLYAFTRQIPAGLPVTGVLRMGAQAIPVVPSPTIGTAARTGTDDAHRDAGRASPLPTKRAVGPWIRGRMTGPGTREECWSGLRVQRPVAIGRRRRSSFYQMQLVAALPLDRA